MKSIHVIMIVLKNNGVVVPVAATESVVAVNTIIENQKKREDVLNAFVTTVPVQ